MRSNRVIKGCEVSFFYRTSTAHALFAERDCTAIGMAVYFVSYSTWLEKNPLYLENLYVSVNSRGQGAGKESSRKH